MFVERIVRPAYEALEGQHLHEWIEDAADRLSEIPGHRANAGFGDAYKENFFVSTERLVPYAEDQTSSAAIKLGALAHEISVRRVQGRDRRALIAHELGHALIYNNKSLWKRISRSKLLVDPTQERLADDVARSLLYPRAYLKDVMGAEIGRGQSASELLKKLVSFYNAPVRFALARMLQFSQETAAAIIYATVPLQRELFPTEKIGPQSRPQTRWIVRYTPVTDPKTRSFYPFLDFVEVRKSLATRSRDELPIFYDPAYPVDANLVRYLTRRSDEKLLGGYQQFKVLALADVGETRHLAIICK